MQVGPDASPQTHATQAKQQEQVTSKLTPLKKAIREYAARVSLKLQVQLRFAVAKALAVLHGQQMSSACSGCDIAFLCAEELLCYWAGELGEECRLQHGFACEHSKEKQLFLRTQFGLGALFHDVSELQKLRAQDILSGKQTFISTPVLFSAGFSCKSRTPLSSKSSANRNCVQNHQQDTETSYTFDNILAFIVQHRPRLCILENVPALLQKDQAAQSDAEWIISELHRHNYVARFWKFAAEDFGSRASRTRIYFVAWLLPPAGSPDRVISPQMVLQKLEWLEDVFQCMTLMPYSSVEFVHGVSSAEEIDALFFDDSVSSAKMAKAEPKWQEEHCNAFRAAGLTWPLALPATGSTLQVKEGSLHPAYLNTRACELLYYLHTVFPMTTSPSGTDMQVEYVDVNPTLGRSVQNGSPWKSLCPTITGASQMCCRYRQGTDEKITVRPLSGQECMSLIGWDPSYYSQQAAMSDVLLRNLAGNAFSAFAFTPMLLLAMAGLDTIETEARACTIPAVDNVAVAEGSEDDEFDSD